MSNKITFEENYIPNESSTYRKDVKGIIEAINLEEVIGDIEVDAAVALENPKTRYELHEQVNILKGKTKDKADLIGVVNRLVPKDYLSESAIGVWYDLSKTNVKVEESNGNPIYRLFNGKTIEHRIIITSKIYTADPYTGVIRNPTPKAEHYAKIIYRCKKDSMTKTP